jgi:signal transduction histidine kinase
MLDTLVHDLKNALAVVTANLDWAAEQVADTNPELSDGLADGREGATRMRSLLEDLSIVNKLERSEQPLRRESIRVSDVVRAVVSSRAHDAEVRNISLCTDVDEELAYTGDRDLLERVLDGLVETSIRRAPSSGRVSLSARLADGLEIAVNSSPTIRAPGAEGDDEAALRDPMKAALRLYFCRKAVEAAHGRMESFKPDEASRSLVVKLPLVG